MDVWALMGDLGMGILRRYATLEFAGGNHGLKHVAKDLSSLRED